MSYLSDSFAAERYAETLVQDFYNNKKLDFTVRNLCRDSQIDPSDLKQNVAIKIFFGAKTFEPGTNFEAWATTICKNEFINAVRHASRRLDSTKVVSTDVLAYVQTSKDLSFNDGEMALQCADIENVVKMIPDAKLRECFVRRVFDGDSYNDIAEDMNLPRGTVNSSIFRARGYLGKHPIIKDVAKDYGI